MKPGRVRERFPGRIAGVGSTSGVRVVVGRWDDGPWGPFADVMVEDADGHRVLLAPGDRVRDAVALVAPGGRRPYAAGRGPRSRAGPGGDRSRLVRSGRPGGACRPARRPHPRRGRGDRREWYGATSIVAVAAIEGEWRGADLGALAPVDPPCRFGFSSAPERPSVTSVVSTIERPA